MDTLWYRKLDALLLVLEAQFITYFFVSCTTCSLVRPFKAFVIIFLGFLCTHTTRCSCYSLLGWMLVACKIWQKKSRNKTRSISQLGNMQPDTIISRNKCRVCSPTQMLSTLEPIEAFRLYEEVSWLRVAIRRLVIMLQTAKNVLTLLFLIALLLPPSSPPLLELF